MMKKFVLFFLLIIISSQIYSQRNFVEYQQNWDKKKLFWGFYLGLNMKSFKISYKTADDNFINVDSKIGFNVGLIGDLRIHKNINLRFEPGLSSNTKELYFTYIAGEPNVNIREVKGTYMRFPLIIKFSTNRYFNVRPYVLGGISYDYNFSSNEKNGDDNSSGEFRMTTNNFSYEVGVGIDLYLPYFIFSPSIRGVFSINDELVRDYDSASQWTGNVDYFGTRGIFIKLSFH